MPWNEIQAHAHWERLVLVPFADPHLSAFDLAGNFLLFLPAGFLQLQMGGPAARWKYVVAAAFVLSCSGELVQVFVHGRHPTLTDVVMNVSGGLAGAALARIPLGRT
jgi:glycopeptide antibiotics resistance protein